MEVKIDIATIAKDLIDIEISGHDIARQILPGLSSAGLQFWKRLAQTRLHMSSRDYVAGIQLVVHDENHHELILTGMLPNMIENGWAGGDMRQWMLRSPKAKTTKRGTKYLVVPFRHGTPNTSGRNVGEAMPREIHKSAKKLEATTTDIKGQKTHWGQRLNQITARSEKAREILRTKRRDWHTTSIYTGMVRQEKTYERATQSQYTTFRVISTNARDPRSWHHNGIQPRHFAAETSQHLGRMVDSLVQGAMKR